MLQEHVLTYRSKMYKLKLQTHQPGSLFNITVLPTMHTVLLECFYFTNL